MESVRGEMDITADFETTGESVTLDIIEDHIFGIHVDADAVASFELDVSDRRGDWFEADTTWEDTETIRDGGFQASRHVRLKVSTGGGTGGANDTANVLLSSSGSD